MAYESGTYTDMHDLLSKMNTFLAANGWTVNSYIADASGYESWTGLDYTGAKRLHIQKTAADSTVMYFNFKAVSTGIIFGEYNSSQSKIDYSGKSRYRSEIRGIGVNGSTDYDVGEAWDEQPGYPTAGTGTESIGACITEVPASGSNTYYIFQNGDVVVVAAEISTGRYVYLAFGCLTKSGVYTGGQFYSASTESYEPSAASIVYGGSPVSRAISKSQFLANIIAVYSQGFGVYLNVESDAGWRHNGREDNVGTDTSEHSYYIRLGAQSPYAKSTEKYVINFNNFIWDRNPNHFNGVSILAPIYIFSKRVNGRYAYLGIPEGVRAVNLTNYNVGDEIVIGSDTWVVLLAYAKTDEESTVTNLNDVVGFAFLKVV